MSVFNRATLCLHGILGHMPWSCVRPSITSPCSIGVISRGTGGWTPIFGVGGRTPTYKYTSSLVPTFQTKVTPLPCSIKTAKHIKHTITPPTPHDGLGTLVWHQRSLWNPIHTSVCHIPSSFNPSPNSMIAFCQVCQYNNVSITKHHIRMYNKTWTKQFLVQLSMYKKSRSKYRCLQTY